MDFAEQGLKTRGRKQLIYTFLIKLMHNLFMGKGERGFELRGCSKACFQFLSHKLISTGPVAFWVSRLRGKSHQ